MHDEIFFRQQEWAGQGEQASTIYSAIAEELDLDLRDFNDCLSSGRYDAAIEANLQEGSRLGVTGTPSFFVSGYPIRGAQPYDLFDYAIGLAEEGTLADAYEQPAQQQAQATPAAPPEPVDVPIEDAVFAMGDADAPVVIVEYTDFQCPFCSRHHLQTLPQIISDYVESGLVLYVFKDFPLTSIHPQAVVAAEAARCAADQEQYLPMHDMLFERQTEWGGMENAVEIFTGYADEIGLDTEAFAACMESHRFQEAVMADLEEGSRFGVGGTPAFFLNGLPLSGAQPFTVFEQAISQLLAAESQ
jgi:protein-disulfide isomerase